MKRSRLKLFKATSMTISILGMIMIIATVGVFTYIAVRELSYKVSSSVDRSLAYDQLAALRYDYSSLSNQFDVIQRNVNSYGSKEDRNDLYDAQIELVKANSAIGDVESALSSNLPADEVNNRISIAANQLQTAGNSLNSVRI
ncbi:MAG: hypothetical protein PQ964_04755 [Methanobacteriaceae archaeon]|jgi:hypothetical protein